jgi:hypothetical protein
MIKIDSSLLSSFCFFLPSSYSQQDDMLLKNEAVNVSELLMKVRIYMILFHFKRFMI